MKELISKIPWGKISAPVLPVLAVDIYLGGFIKDIYAINVANKITDQFPTDAHFCIFLAANLFILVVYLGLSAWGHINQERVRKLKSQLELSIIE